MLKNFEWNIIQKYISYDNKFISLVRHLCIIGITVGVMTLVIITSVMNGYKYEIIKRMVGTNGHISINKQNKKAFNYKNLIKKIKIIGDIKAINPVVLGQALIQTKNYSTSIIVKGTDFKSLDRKPILAGAFIRKNKFYRFNKDEIYIGNTLSKNLKLYIGDKLRIIIPSFDTTIFGLLPRIKTFYITGIFDVGIYNYTTDVVFIPIETAKLLFDTGKLVNTIEIILRHHKYIKKVTEIILINIFDKNISITNWYFSNRSLIAALRIEKTTMLIILMLIVMMSTFNVIAILIMLVKEKYKSIAILRSIGISRISIVKIFISTGAIISFIGISLGIILGICFILNIKNVRKLLEITSNTTLFNSIVCFLTSIPLELDIDELISIVVISMIVSLLAIIYPAWKVSNMVPAESLRYE